MTLDLFSNRIADAIAVDAPTAELLHGLAPEVRQNVTNGWRRAIKTECERIEAELHAEHRAAVEAEPEAARLKEEQESQLRADEAKAAAASQAPAPDVQAAAEPAVAEPAAQPQAAEPQEGAAQ